MNRANFTLIIPRIALLATMVCHCASGRCDSSAPILFQPGPAFDLGLHYHVLAADYNGDGKADIALRGRDDIALYRQLETGAFSYDQSLAAYGHGVMSASDMDADGDPDFLGAGFTCFEPFICFSTQTSVYRNDGVKGFVQRPIDVPYIINVISLDWGDYDLDGDMDLAVSGASGGPNIFPVPQQAYVGLYRNDDGAFTGVADLPTSAASVVRFGRVDGDAYPDLFVAQYQAAPTVYRNTGDGGFAPTGLNMGENPCSDAQFGDVDGDGDQDLVRTTADGMLAYLNNGSGQLGVGAWLVTNAPGDQLRLADLDADGDDEVVLRIKETVRIYRYEPRRLGWLPLGLDLGLVNMFDVADFYGDGRMDLVVDGEEGIRVLLNITEPAARLGMVSARTARTSRVKCPKPGEDCHINARVICHNEGNERSPKGWIEAFLSGDDVLDSGDLLVKSVPLKSLRPGGRTTRRIRVPLPDSTPADEMHLLVRPYGELRTP